MKIFTVTMTPVSPPYDDGPKNISLAVARRQTNHFFYFISEQKNQFASAHNIHFIRSCFQKSGRHSMTVLQKVFVFVTLLSRISSIDLLQFFFTPKPYFSAFFGMLVKICRKKSIQIVSSVHTLTHSNQKTDLKKLFFADRVVVFSRYTKSVLAELGVSGLVHIYPGVDTTRFYPGVEKKSDLDTNKYMYVLYPGSYSILNQSFSFKEFANIIQDVVLNNNQVKFIMACRKRTPNDHLLEKVFRNEIEAQKLTESVIYMSTVENMPALVSAITVGIMPASKPMVGVLEIPIVLLEMAALEKPVVYAGLAPLDELYEYGIGDIVSTNAWQDYSVKINELIANSDKRLACAQKSRQAVLEHFTIDLTAKQFEQMYRGM